MMHRCTAALGVFLVLGTCAHAQEQTWHINLSNGTRVTFAVPLRRIGDYLLVLRNERLTIPISTISSVEQHTAGQSASYALLGVLGGGAVGYLVGDGQGVFPVAVGGGLGGLLGLFAGSAQAEDDRLRDFDSLDDASRYAFLDSLIAARAPLADRPVSPAEELLPGPARSGGGMLAEAPGSPKGPDARDSEALQQGRFTLAPHVGVSLPMGMFGEQGQAWGSGAGMGWGGGCEGVFRLSGALACVGSLDFSFHRSLRPILDRGLDAGSYLLLWPMAGIRLTRPLDEANHLYLQAEAGALMQGSPEISTQANMQEVLVERETSSTFGFSFGAGWIFGSRLSCTLRYLNGGISAVPTAWVEYYVRDPRTLAIGERAHIVTVEQPTALLQFSIGIVL